MKTIIIILSLISIFSCKGQNRFDSLEQDNKQLEGWRTEVEYMTVDTSLAIAILPNPKIKLTLYSQSYSPCPKVIMDFYPIELKKTIEKRLFDHLRYRSSLNPPSPHEYSSGAYYILIWNLHEYGQEQSSKCENLERALIDYFDLIKLRDPINIRQTEINKIKTLHNNK
jgi:hypothetical protein